MDDRYFSFTSKRATSLKLLTLSLTYVISSARLEADRCSFLCSHLTNYLEIEVPVPVISWQLAMSVINSKTKDQARALLAAYLTRLSTRPLQTKMITSGILSFVQEVLASHLAHVPRRPTSNDPSLISNFKASIKIDSKAFKMALYGALISAPMGHVLVGLLQKAFAGKTSPFARFCQVICSNLFVAPIQAIVYLSSVSVINGLRDPEAITRVVKSRFFSVLKISWSTSPLAIIIAQNFIPPELWVPWFNIVTFSVGTYLNTRLKRLAAKANSDGVNKS